jgi:hypothetical protein
LPRSKFGKKGICPQITQIGKAGLNRRALREQSFSLLPPFPPVRRISICANLRQSAGNSGFGCGWPRCAIRGKIFAKPNGPDGLQRKRPNPSVIAAQR